MDTVIQTICDLVFYSIMSVLVGAVICTLIDRYFKGKNESYFIQQVAIQTKVTGSDAKSE